MSHTPSSPDIHWRVVPSNLTRDFPDPYTDSLLSYPAPVWTGWTESVDEWQQTTHAACLKRDQALLASPPPRS